MYYIICLQFISAGVHGVFSWAFCDFGPLFEVLDSTGEEPKEFFVWKITKVWMYMGRTLVKIV